MSDDRKVHGHCPMGCGRTLFLGDGGYVTCSFIPCPCPTAVDDLLADREPEHIVEIRDTHFTVRHPLRERVNDVFLACQLDPHIREFNGPPMRPGRYRVRWDGDRWAWEALPGEVTS